ncbi:MULTISPECIES: DUF4382 domain-containing protein [unclassified Natrinema]|uniref:DUF4382 domain-containing protein n=1 Tax=unclassified Natrinema TaxID=2622230 RepID=UPI00026D4D48|nr:MULTISPECIES: DUF4382 domain-containing protein [unclassified Natrinema]AFO55851.1 hypothetical protein NJ7G_0597 [Natrinema sp. J7-2]
MNRRAVQLVLVAALVAVAGCAGGMGGEPQNNPTDESSTIDADGSTGTAAFYVSDEPNAIDEFEHLNVTITKVGFKKTGDGSDGDSNGTDGDAGNESPNETADGDEKSEADGKTDDGAADERWIEYDVDNRTVDLTELQGANASMIDEFELPAGDYETVFIYVSDTEGVLTDGSTTRVKLPSNKLQLHTDFTVGTDERVDFVYDIAPHKAGKSGKYILKPVLSESGTGDDVEIRDIDTDEDEPRGNGDDGGNGGTETGASDANAADD